MVQQLDDEFSKITFDGLDVLAFQEVVQVDLFGSHGFGLHDALRLALFHNLPDFLTCLFGIIGPDHFSAVGREVRFEIQQVLVQVFNGLPFDQVGLDLTVFQIKELTLSLFESNVIFINVVIDNLSVI